MIRSPYWLLSALLTGLITGCATPAAGIDKNLIFRAYALDKITMDTATDEHGGKYDGLLNLTPEPRVPQQCQTDPSEEDPAHYHLRTENGHAAIPPLNEEKRFSWTYSYNGYQQGWNRPFDYATVFKEPIQEYLMATYGYVVQDITVNTLPLEGPINGYKATEVSGEILYTSHPTKVTEECVLNIGEDTVHLPYRVRFLDAGDSWMVLNSGGEKIWQVSKDPNSTTTYDK